MSIAPGGGIGAALTQAYASARTQALYDEIVAHQAREMTAVAAEAGKWAAAAEADRRITRLLEANNEQLEARRAAERKQLESAWDAEVWHKQYCEMRELAERYEARLTEYEDLVVAPLGSDIGEWLKRNARWSAETFGAGRRTGGILAHIRKELDEIEAKPEDLSEWIDVMILAMDGYWRHGGEPRALIQGLEVKQKKNFARSWPTPVSEDAPVEHIREEDE